MASAGLSSARKVGLVPVTVACTNSDEGRREIAPGRQTAQGSDQRRADGSVHIDRLRRSDRTAVRLLLLAMTLVVVVVRAPLL